jgi:hypothetical protein
MLGWVSLHLVRLASSIRDKCNLKREYICNKNIYLFNSLGQTCLHLALSTYNFDLLSKMIDHGGDVTLGDKKMTKTKNETKKDLPLDVEMMIPLAEKDEEKLIGDDESKRLMEEEKGESIFSLTCKDNWSDVLKRKEDLIGNEKQRRKRRDEEQLSNCCQLFDDKGKEIERNGEIDR